MLTLSPNSSSACVIGPWKNLVSQQAEQSSNFRETNATLESSFPQFSPIPHQQVATAKADQINMVQKLNHNASERDRRKKINGLYSSLRVLLPAADRTKKISIPATVSRVVKYIPELQEEVKRLTKEKDKLLSSMSMQSDAGIDQENQLKQGKTFNAPAAVSAIQLNDREVMVQISTNLAHVHTVPLSTILVSLEQDGLLLMNSSSFESFGGRVFYNLHFQVEGSHSILDSHSLSEKLLSLYEKSVMLFP